MSASNESALSADNDEREDDYADAAFEAADNGGDAADVDAAGAAAIENASALASVQSTGDVASAENGIVHMQARARGMLARKHDVKELAQASTVTKAEAKAERQRALGKDVDGQCGPSETAAAASDPAHAVDDASAICDQELVADAAVEAAGNGGDAADVDAAGAAATENSSVPPNAYSSGHDTVAGPVIQSPLSISRAPRPLSPPPLAESVLPSAIVAAESTACGDDLSQPLLSARSLRESISSVIKESAAADARAVAFNDGSHSNDEDDSFDATKLALSLFSSADVMPHRPDAHAAKGGHKRSPRFDLVPHFALLPFFFHRNSYLRGTGCRKVSSFEVKRPPPALSFVFVSTSCRPFSACAHSHS